MKQFTHKMNSDKYLRLTLDKACGQMINNGAVVTVIHTELFQLCIKAHLVNSNALLCCTTIGFTVLHSEQH